MERFIKRISQVGVVVKDLDKAMETFKEEYGVAEWNVFNANENFGDVLINGKPGKLNIRGAITGELGGFEIELIQPTGEGPFADYLKEHGPGLHHFAVITPNWETDFYKILDREKANGRKVWLEAEMAEGVRGEKMHFAYIDRREDMGVFMELYDENRE